jgi:uncharacterized protein
MKIFIDTNIPMYAAGKEHHLKDGCVKILNAAASGELEAYTDSEVFQEILYRYYHISQIDMGFQVFDHFSTIMSGNVLPVTHRDVNQARLLAESEPAAGLSPRDLIHLAVMLNNGIDTIATTDQAFTRVDAIKVYAP